MDLALTDALTVSRALEARAKRVLPGGVSSPVRAFGAVGGTPRFAARGDGAWLEDVDGHRYLDLLMAWGPLLLGHRHPAVIDAIRSALDAGTAFGTTTAAEVVLAERLTTLFPAIPKLRFVSTGTEAVMSAVRLARAATSRARIVTFAGCYHGHADGLLAAAGSGLVTFSLPSSPGVPAETVASTIVLPYNDLDRAEATFAALGDTIAAVVVEPVAGNMGVVPPLPDFVPGLRRLTREHGALLIFDEVMTGWRVHPLGAQILFDVAPDLTCLGKIVGGGMPAAAYGGRVELMDLIAPSGPVYQAGTLSAHPLAMAAGLATVAALEDRTHWQRAADWAAEADRILTDAARRRAVPLVVQRVGAMFTPFFGEGPVRSWADCERIDRRRYATFFHAMLEAGVHLPPSQFEACFTSSAHDAAALEFFADAVERSLSQVAR